MEKYCRQVFYYETDKMAIVHNANYLRIFEEARLYFMEKIGAPYPVIEEAGVLIPQVDAYVRYHQTLKYGDEFYVEVRLAEFNGARMKYQYEIHRVSDSELTASGFTSHCFVDEVRRMPLNMKKHMPEMYNTLKENIE